MMPDASETFSKMRQAEDRGETEVWTSKCWLHCLFNDSAVHITICTYKNMWRSIMFTIKGAVCVLYISVQVCEIARHARIM